MKKFYVAKNSLEAEIIKDFLEDKGIKIEMKSNNLQGLGIDNPQRILWANDSDIERIPSLLLELNKLLNEKSNEASWRCQKCSEVIEGSFDSCWNCQTEKSS